MRLEYYTPVKILQSEGAHFEKIRPCAMRGNPLLLAALRVAQHDIYTSNLLPTPIEP